MIIPLLIIVIIAYLINKYFMSSGLFDVEECPFVGDVIESITASLPKAIGGQKRAINAVEKAIAGWEFKRRAGVSVPLVLAFSGPTGVGKSETGYRIADAILSKKTKIAKSKRTLPNGLLVLRGEDYSPESEAGSIGLGEIHRRIRSRVIGHLRKCAGNAVIIFDEVQKVAPGTLECLKASLQPRGSISVLGEEDISTENCIFLLISDIGADKIIDVLLRYGDRDAISQTALRTVVTQELEKKFNLGGSIKEVIPFLPMEEPQIKEVLKLKLAEMARQHRGQYWANLIVDNSVTDWYSTRIKYVTHTRSYANPESQANGKIVQAKDGTGDFISLSKVFAVLGARALENSGPIVDLEALLQSHMGTWRKDQVAHIGIVDSSDYDRKHQWGNERAILARKLVELGYSKQEIVMKHGPVPGQRYGRSSEIYLQWCTVKGSMVVPDSSISITTALSDTCETMWFEMLS